jgi:transcriptional regulator with XRE-family HTH domain
MRLSENLNKLKKQGNFNNAQLAEYTGLSRSTVSRVLSHRSSTNADYKPTFNTVRSIAKSVGVPADEIYTYRMDFEILE